MIQHVQCSAKSERPSKSAFPDKTITQTINIIPKKITIPEKIMHKERNKRQLYTTPHEEQKRENQKQEQTEKKQIINK